jgi:hypothetical protein
MSAVNARSTSQLFPTPVEQSKVTSARIYLTFLFSCYQAESHDFTIFFTQKNLHPKLTASLIKEILQLAIKFVLAIPLQGLLESFRFVASFQTYPILPIAQLPRRLKIDRYDL